MDYRKLNAFKSSTPEQGKLTMLPAATCLSFKVNFMFILKRDRISLNDLLNPVTHVH